MTDRIALASGDWTAEVSPSIGGAILSLAHRGVAILRPTPDEVVAAHDVRLTACYPLIPYANRIADGRFAWDGVEHQLAPNFPGPHTLHGVGWRRAWRVEAASEAACELALEHRPAISGAEDWPFAFDARLGFELGPEGLIVRVSLVNAGDGDAPGGFGLHAFFPLRAGQRLAFRAEGGWSNGADMLPDARHTGGAWDFSAAKAVEGTDLDNDFDGWDGRARMAAPDGPAVTMNADPAFRVLRVYTPPGRDYFAVEPVTHRADAVHHPRGSYPMAVLAPGERLAGEVVFGLETPA